MKILLFTAHFGDGHRQVATALRAEFERQGILVQEIDCMRSAHPSYARFNEACFELTTKYVPYLYGLSYTLTRRFPNNSFLWKMMSAGARQRAEEAIQEFQPDAVLQLFPEHTLDRLPMLRIFTELGGTLRRPVSGVVVTDFSTHSRWFCPHMDVYYVPDEAFVTPAKALIKSTSSPEIMVSGIPVREQFSKSTVVPSTSGHILVATGGRGLFGGLKDVLLALYEHREGRDVVVMCGRNTTMLKLVEELGATRPGLHALPFVEEVAPWLKFAAFAVVKPGGVTVAECLASGCPMLFYRPPLGQELDNARFVTKLGAGKIANNLTELSAMTTWLSQPQNQKTSSDAAQKLGRAEAAERVVRDVIRRVREKTIAKQTGKSPLTGESK